MLFIIISFRLSLFSEGMKELECFLSCFGGFLHRWIALVLSAFHEARIQNNIKYDVYHGGAKNTQ